MNDSDILDYVKNNKLKIVVKPNSSENKLLGYDEIRKAVKVAIAAPAEENKANLEVIKFFSKLFKKRIKIKFGLKSKEKILILN